MAAKIAIFLDSICRSSFVSSFQSGTSSILGGNVISRGARPISFMRANRRCRVTSQPTA
jgi:hypothetical protein